MKISFHQFLATLFVVVPAVGFVACANRGMEAPGDPMEDAGNPAGTGGQTGGQTGHTGGRSGGAGVSGTGGVVSGTVARRLAALPDTAAAEPAAPRIPAAWQGRSRALRDRRHRAAMELAAPAQAGAAPPRVASPAARLALGAPAVAAAAWPRAGWAARAPPAARAEPAASSS